MGNDEDEELLETEIPSVRMNPKNPTSREKQEHEVSGHVVYRNWCGALCRWSRCWWTTSNRNLRRRGKRKDNSDCSFLLRLLDTGKRRHVSNSDLSRQHVWSNGGDVWVTERSHSIFHFVSCWFHQRSSFSQNHF